ncbi:hypothetical protein B0T14DRAFT_206985 [Immersiella caudata]|uniref:Uncharacterized protein n=1 Tax=Immersiella caudata TaxID=314043 RepID=A0AA39WPS8_9PEZI|nr:hypothetical protein B0T14DRAFT_206985 [Immersiella caudata]
MPSTMLHQGRVPSHAGGNRCARAWLGEHVSALRRSSVLRRRCGCWFIDGQTCPRRQLPDSNMVSPKPRHHVPVRTGVDDRLARVGAGVFGRELSPRWRWRSAPPVDKFRPPNLPPSRQFRHTMYKDHDAGCFFRDNVPDHHQHSASLPGPLCTLFPPRLSLLPPLAPSLPSIPTAIDDKGPKEIVRPAHSCSRLRIHSSLHQPPLGRLPGLSLPLPGT